MPRCNSLFRKAVLHFLAFLPAVPGCRHCATSHTVLELCSRIIVLISCSKNPSKQIHTFDIALTQLHSFGFHLLWYEHVLLDVSQSFVVAFANHRHDRPSLNTGKPLTICSKWSSLPCTRVDWRSMAANGAEVAPLQDQDQDRSSLIAHFQVCFYSHCRL